MPLTQDQIEARAKGIGGSDAGAIVGVSPYRSAFDVWARFHLPDTTPARDDDDDEDGPRHWGDILECPIADEYARRMRVAIERPVQTFRHPAHPFILGHPDRLVVGEDRGLEIKTASLRVADQWGSPEEQEFPLAYRLQCLHYMAITGRARWDLAVLIGGSDFRIYSVERDLEVERALVETEVEFWRRHVEGGVRPEILDSPAASAWLKALYPEATRPAIEATPDLVALAREYAIHSATEKAEQRAKDAAGNALRAAIGEAEGFRWGPRTKKGVPRFKATWTNNAPSRRIDVDAVLADLYRDHPEIIRPIVERHSALQPGTRVLRVTVEPEHTAALDAAPEE